MSGFSLFSRKIFGIKCVKVGLETARKWRFRAQ